MCVGYLYNHLGLLLERIPSYEYHLHCSEPHPHFFAKLEPRNEEWGQTKAHRRTAAAGETKGNILRVSLLGSSNLCRNCRISRGRRVSLLDRESGGRGSKLPAVSRPEHRLQCSGQSRPGTLLSLLSATFRGTSLWDRRNVVQRDVPKHEILRMYALSLL